MASAPYYPSAERQQARRYQQSHRLELILVCPIVAIRAPGIRSEPCPVRVGVVNGAKRVDAVAIHREIEVVRSLEMAKFPLISREGYRAPCPARKKQ